MDNAAMLNMENAEKVEKHSGYTKNTSLAYALSQGGGFMLIQATVAS